MKIVRIITIGVSLTSGTNIRIINIIMRIQFQFPSLILYTQKVTKTSKYVVRGKSIGPVIVIGDSYSRDLGLLAHEMSHVKEWWTHGLLIHNILYGALRSYRLRTECKAYYAQWKYEPTLIKKQDFTDRIFLFYNLKYSRDYVEKVFSKYFDPWELI